MRPSVLQRLVGVGLLAALAAPAPLDGQDAEPVPVLDVGPERVGTLPVGSLLTREASFFDLEGRSLRFTPEGDGYRVVVEPLEFREDFGPELGEPEGGSPLSGRRRDQPMARSWSVDLPFAFPFAGESWTSVWVNSTGSLSFGRPETETNGERGAWADGTMRAVGAAIDVRSAVGLEQVIAPLWSLYGSFPDENAIHVRASDEAFVVTWNTVRRKLPNAGYDPLGANVFQAVLTPDGTIAFHYRDVPERDGIVGVFPGGFGEFERLDGADDLHGDAEAAVDILSAEVAEAGTALRFSLTLAAPVPQRIEEGSLSYRFTLGTGGAECRLGLSIDDGGRSASSNCVGAPPRSAGQRVSGRRVDLFVSKVALDDPAELTWRAEVTRSHPDGEDVSDEIGSPDGRPIAPVFPAHGGYELDGGSAEVVSGNLFQVFHYPAISKRMARVSGRVYEVHAADDDIMSVFTDFRIDDLFNHGPSTGTVNDPIEGIGRGGEARDDPSFGTSRLQVMHSPVYLGPRFSERVGDDDYAYDSYAFAVGWISHELMHRWSAFVHFRHPDVDDPDVLLDGCGCHWGGGLHNPSVVSVSALYSEEPYTETSPMGGSVWDENEDGTFTRRPKPYMAPSGASALDLYVMGLIGPEEVGETFVLVDREDLGDDRVAARKVPVRIEDVIAGSGVRVPPGHEAQREFQMGVYLLHRDGRDPDPAFRRQAADIGAEMIRYFGVATGGRMTLRIPAPVGATSNPAR